MTKLFALFAAAAVLMPVAYALANQAAQMVA